MEFQFQSIWSSTASMAWDERIPCVRWSIERYALLEPRSRRARHSTHERLLEINALSWRGNAIGRVINPYKQRHDPICINFCWGAKWLIENRKWEDRFLEDWTDGRSSAAIVSFWERQKRRKRSFPKKEIPKDVAKNESKVSSSEFVEWYQGRVGTLLNNLLGQMSQTLSKMR